MTHWESPVATQSHRATGPTRAAKPAWSGAARPETYQPVKTPM
jgi:hypothetical protein